MEDRDLPSTRKFSGIITYAGKHQGTECSLANQAQAKDKALMTYASTSICANLSMTEPTIFLCHAGFLQPAPVQDVVILGTGAFALEAMEAAHRAGARAITLLTRKRDRSALFITR
jgi:threonine dehydrogenase-like Zn-dependent dehydrogenase